MLIDIKVLLKIMMNGYELWWYVGVVEVFKN